MSTKQSREHFYARNYRFIALGDINSTRPTLLITQTLSVMRGEIIQSSR